jgi:multiple sugar transport system substrate-binding protein
VVVAAGAGGGADAGDAEEVTIDVWVHDSGDFGEFQETLEEEFEAAHPNIDINSTKFPEDQYDVKVDTAIAAGEAPDIITNFGKDRPREGQLLPLDDFLAEKGIDLSTFNQAVVGPPANDFGCYWEGQIYCLGSFLGTALMFYNKDLFDAAGIEYPASWPPMTIEEYADVSCQLRDEDAGVWGTAFSGMFLPTELLVDPEGRTVDGYINSPETIEQYELLTGIVRDGCAPTSSVLDPWTQGADMLAQGQLASVLTDFTALDRLDAAGINYGVTAPPTPEGVEPFFYVWTDSVGVLEDTDHPDEAMEYIAFLATEGQRLRVEVEGTMPLDSAVAEELNWAQDNPGRLDALEIVPHARALVFTPTWVWDPMDDAVNQMMGGERSVEDALNDVAGAIQDELDEAWEDWEETGGGDPS